MSLLNLRGLYHIRLDMDVTKCSIIFSTKHLHCNVTAYKNKLSEIICDKLLFEIVRFYSILLHVVRFDACFALALHWCENMHLKLRV